MRYIYVIFSVIFLLCNDAAVFAQSRQKLEEQRKKTLQEIEETNKFLDETQKGQKESIEKLVILNGQIDRHNKIIQGTNSEIKKAEKEINETSAVIRGMNEDIERHKSEYAKLVHHAYKNRGKYNQLIYILAAKDFNEAYRRMKYFQQYSEYRKNQVSEIESTQKELNKYIQQLATQKKEKEKLLTNQKKETQKLEVVKTEQNQVVQSLKSRERELKKQLAAQQKKAEKLQKDIESFITQEAKKRKGTATNLYEKLTPEERLVSNNFKDNKGRLPWPTEKGIITGIFGTNAHPLYKDIKVNNNGIDITTTGNAQVRAVFDGVVAKIWSIRGENITVLLRHGNFMTIYQNLVDVTVKQGDKVSIKQTIGQVFTEKNAKTAVLHFEIWQELTKQNPELWIISK